MTDLATLGLEVKSDKVVTANDNLKKLSDNARGVQRATDQMAGSAARADTATGKMALQAKAATASFGLLRASVIAAAAAVAALVGSALAFRQFVTNTIEAQKAQAQLAAVLRSTNAISGQSIRALNDHAMALQRLTTFGDDAINAAQGILLTFTRIRGDVFPQATKAVLNLSAALGMDLKGASLQLGKALNDPVLGMSALSRAGIQFTESQKATVKQLVATGQIMAAQKIILKELEVQFGGSAEAARKTLGGALTALGNAWGDLFELSSGTTESLRQAIEDLITAISKPAFVQFISLIGTVLVQAMTLAVNGVNLLIDGFDMLVENSDMLLEVATAAGIALATYFGPGILAAMASGLTTLGIVGVAAIRSITVAMMANPLGLLAVGVAAAITAIYVFRDEIKNAIGVDVVQIVKDVANIIIASFVAAYEDIVLAWDRLPSALADLMYQAADWVVGGIEDMINKAIGLLNDLTNRAALALAAVGKPLDPKTYNNLILGPVDFGGVTNPHAGAAADYAKAREEMLNRVFSTNWLGVIFNVITGTRKATDAIKELDHGLAAIPGGFDEAGDAAIKASDEFKRFEGIADGFAEKMFPGEYARREAEELLKLMEQFGSHLDEFQRAAVNSRIADMFEAARLGLRELDADTEKSAKKMSDGFMEIGEILAGIFEGPKEDVWDWADAVIDAIGAIGQKLMSMAEMDWTKMFGGNGGADKIAATAAALTQAGKSVPAVYQHDDRYDKMNSFPAPSAPAARASAGSSVAVQAWNFFASKGLASHQIAGIMGNIKAESNFNSSAVGDGGLAQGLFQHHPDRRGGNILGNTQGQLDLAWRELQTSEGSVLKALTRATNVAEATQAFIGFERPLGWKPGNPTAGHNYSGRLSAANQAFAQYGAGTVATGADVVVAAPSAAAPSASGGTGSAAKSTTGGKAMAALGAAAAGFSSGYQAQNPIMGAFSGALGGLASGNPIGIIAGAIGGFIGGLIGAAKAMSEARAELKKLSFELDNFVAVGMGGGLGDLAKTNSDYASKAAEYQKIAEKAGDSARWQEIENAKYEFRKRTVMDFGAGFTGNIASLKSGQGLGGAFASGQEGLLSVRDEMLNFIGDVRYAYGKDSNQVAEANAAAQQYVMTLLSFPEEMSPMQEAMESLKGVGSSLASVLMSLGMTSEQAAAAVQESLISSIQELQKEFSKDLLGSVRDLTGAGYLNDVDEAQEKYNERLKDASALGLDASLATTELGLSLARIAANSNSEEVLAYASSIGISGQAMVSASNMIASGAARSSEVFENLSLQLLTLSVDTSTLDGQLKVFDRQREIEIKSLKRAGAAANELSLMEIKLAADRQNIINQYNRERVNEAKSALDESLSAYQNFIDGIVEYKNSLLLDSSLSNLSPIDKLKVAREEFDRIRGRVQSGDVEALPLLQGAIQEYATQARSYYASTEQYAEIMRDIRSTTDNAQSYAENQVEIGESALSMARQQISGLEAVNDSVLSVTDAVSGLQGAIDTYLGAGGTFSGALEALGNVAIYAASLGEQATLAAQSTASSATSMANIAQSIDARLAAINISNGIAGGSSPATAPIPEPAPAPRLSWIQQAANWISGLFGFAEGGYTGGSSPSQVMGVVHGQEFVANATATERYRPQLEAMNMGMAPSFAANSNKLDFDRLNRITEIGLSAVVTAIREEMGSLQREVRSLREDTRRSAEWNSKRKAA